MMKVSCHCGAATMTVPGPPTEVTECNCAMCRRIGARWAYYPASKVKLANIGSTQPYVWGERMVAYHRCRRCGCITHWQSLSAAQPRMAVNARMIDEVDWDQIRVRHFDGAGAWAYLEPEAG
jgi:hypothetical protein